MMRLFLTSNGLTNRSIVRSFNELVNIPADMVNIAFIPTAANAEEGDRGWLINDLKNLRNQGYRRVDSVDISLLPIDVWKPRLEEANVIFFSGGNTSYLMYWLIKSGLRKMLPELLLTRVFAGISAGSCITGKTIINPIQNLFEEKYDESIVEGLGLVDFQFVPHLNSSFYEKICEECLAKEAVKVKEVIYAVDDNTAIKVVGGQVEVISEGEYLILNDK